MGLRLETCQTERKETALKKHLGLLVLMLLVCGQAFASSHNYSVKVTSESSVVIYLPHGDVADSLVVSQFAELQVLQPYIERANNGEGQMVVKATKSAKGWKIVQRLQNISQQERARLNGVYDAAALAGRFQNGVRILKAMGLSTLVAEDAGSNITAVPSIVIYYQAFELVENDNVDQLLYISNVLADSLQVLRDDFDRHLQEKPAPEYKVIQEEDRLQLGVGVEAVMVNHGEPLAVPALSLTYRQNDWLYSITGGFLPYGKSEFGDKNHKLLAGTVTWLPKGKSFGPTAGLLYSSMSVDSVNEYLQQGYGPYLGLRYRCNHLDIHAAGGFQSLDHYQSGRVNKLSASAGATLYF